MKFGDCPVSKNKLAILKRVHHLIYKTNRNKPNKLFSQLALEITRISESVWINNLNAFTGHLNSIPSQGK